PLSRPIYCFSILYNRVNMFLSDESNGGTSFIRLNTHSFIDFITKYLGEKIGFIAGWTYWICWITIAMADVTATGLYIEYWFPNIPQWVPGLVAVVVLLSLNLVTVGLFGETEFWFSLIKIIAIIALIVSGIAMVIV